MEGGNKNQKYLQFNDEEFVDGVPKRATCQ